MSPGFHASAADSDAVYAKAEFDLETDDPENLKLKAGDIIQVNPSIFTSYLQSCAAACPE